MKILIVSHMYPSTAKEISGIFVHEQAIELARLGCEVKVISAVPWAPFPVNRLKADWRAYPEIPLREIREGIESYYPRYVSFPGMHLLEYSGYFMYYGLRKIAEQIYDSFKFDLIHAHAALPSGYASALLARRFEKPLVITIHGQDAYYTIQKGRRCRKAVHWAVTQADRVIMVSQPLRNVLEKGLETTFSNILVIHNGVSRGKIYLGKIEQPESSKVILTLGGLSERKGHRYAIEAMACLMHKHSAVHYKIVGAGPLRRKLEGLSNKLGVESKVEFLGFVRNDEVPRLLASCDIFLLPSWDEAFGIVYLEAMANGKPVIGCRGEGIEDFVEHGKTGLLVKPKDSGSLVEALDFLLSYPREAQAMGERARKLVLENYTWAKNAEKTIEVYEEVLKNGG